MFHRNNSNPKTCDVVNYGFPEPKTKVRESQQLRTHREVQGLLPRKQGHIESVINTREAAGG